MWTMGVVPAQYRVMGPKAWPGAREAVMNAADRIVYAISGGKHLAEIKKRKKYARDATRVRTFARAA